MSEAPLLAARGVVRTYRSAGRAIEVLRGLDLEVLPGHSVAVVGDSGVGKSTLAGSMAAWLHELGHKVVLADCDSQNSSSEWISEAAPQVGVARYETADEVLEGLPQLRKEADYIVCDGPGSQTETSRALLLWADLAVIPCKASMFEARALAKNTAFVRQAQTIRKGPPLAVAASSHAKRPEASAAADH